MNVCWTKLNQVITATGESERILQRGLISTCAVSLASCRHPDSPLHRPPPPSPSRFCKPCLASKLGSLSAAGLSILWSFPQNHFSTNFAVHGTCWFKTNQHQTFYHQTNLLLCDLSQVQELDGVSLPQILISLLLFAQPGDVSTRRSLSSWPLNICKWQTKLHHWCLISRDTKWPHWLLNVKPGVIYIPQSFTTLVNIRYWMLNIRYLGNVTSLVHIPPPLVTQVPCQ